MSKKICIPDKNGVANELKVGDNILISGKIYCGRDAVLPKVLALSDEDRREKYGIDLEGSLIFHTAVSRAGIGPTSSNKFEIESSIPILSSLGVKVHLGKGKLKDETIKALKENNSIYAIIPPVTALLKSKTISSRVVAFPELGMEALYELEVEEFPAVVAAAHGESLYDKNK